MNDLLSPPPNPANGLGGAAAMPPAVPAVPVIPNDMPRVDPARPNESYAAIPSGTLYHDPTGKVRKKPWRIDVSQPEKSYEAIPEGADYLDDRGQKRLKPVTENVGIGTQALFDMASGDPETQKRILHKFYGGDVKQDSKGFFIDRNGKRIRASSRSGGYSGAISQGVASTLAQALPVAAATGGAIVGSATGPWSGIAGGALGYAGGEWANRAILALAGVAGEDWGNAGSIPRNLAEGAAFEMGGQVLGKAIGSVAAGAQVGAKYAAEALGLPWLLRKIGGVTPEVVSKVAPLSEKEFPTGKTKPDGTPEMRRGINLPPQMAFPDWSILPRLSIIGKGQNIDPVTPSLGKYASHEIKQIAESLGIPSHEIGEPLERTAEVDYAPAGKALHKKYAEALKASNEVLSQKFAEAESTIRTKGLEEESAREKALSAAQAALEENQTAARNVVRAGFQDIFATITRLRSGVMEDGTPIESGMAGDLVRAMAGSIEATRAAHGEHYEKLYNDWDRLYGSHVADLSAQIQEAKSFLKDLPDDIKRNHPPLIRAISNLENAKDGMSTGQLHHLRTMLGDLANWDTLVPGFKNGALKRFRNVIGDALHQSLPEQGSRMLKTIDNDYHIDSGPYRNRTLQKIVDWEATKVPVNAPEAAKEVMQSGTEAQAFLRESFGEPVWNAVVGADMQAAMDASKSIYPEEVDGAKFVKEFLDRDRNDLLAHYPPEVIEKMRLQAQFVMEHTDGGKALLPVTLQRGREFDEAVRKLQSPRMPAYVPPPNATGPIDKYLSDHTGRWDGLTPGHESIPPGQRWEAMTPEERYDILQLERKYGEEAKGFGTPMHPVGQGHYSPIVPGVRDSAAYHREQAEWHANKSQEFLYMMEQAQKRNMPYNDHRISMENHKFNAEEQFRLATEAEEIQMPAKLRAGGDFAKAMQNIYDETVRIEKLSKENPLKLMEKELKRLEKTRKKEYADLFEQHSKGPLRKELSNENAVLSDSAKRIVRSSALLEEAVKEFGPDSPEMKLLARTYIKDVLTHPDVYGLMGISKEMTKLTKEQQEHIFGVRAEDVVLFAKNVNEVLEQALKSDSGSSIMATQAITHPMSTPLPGVHSLSHTAVAAAPPGVLRAVFGYVLSLVIKGYTHPAFFRFVAGALRSTPEEAALAKSIIRKFVLNGGVIGEFAGSAIGSHPDDSPPPIRKPIVGWRQQLASPPPAPPRGGWRSDISGSHP